MKKAAAVAILAASIVALTGCAAAPNPVTTVTVVPVIAAPDSTPTDSTPGTGAVLYTYPGDPRDFGHEVMTPDDSHRVIVGPDFVVSITGDWGKNGYSKHLTKEKVKAIADKLGGEVVTG